MISLHLPNLRQLFCWLFIIMIVSFGLGGLLLVFESDKKYSYPEEYSVFNIPIEKIDKARMNFAIETGTINITGDSIEDIVSGSVRVDTKQYIPRPTHSVINGTINVAIDRPTDLFHQIIGAEEKWDIRLHNRTPISLLLSVGTGDIHVAPGDAQISELALECGAGSLYLDIREWKGNDLPIRIENGAGDITILFPDQSHVSVALERAIGNLFLTGFSGDTHGYYHETKAVDAPVIHVTISQGIGDVTLMAMS